MNRNFQVKCNFGEENIRESTCGRGIIEADSLQPFQNYQQIKDTENSGHT